jgi:plastocyanin
MPGHCHLRFGLVAVAVTFALAACGGSTKTATTSPVTTGPGTSPVTTGPAGTVITIQNLSFSPSAIQAKIGDTITVTNKDGINHTFTADDNSFDSGTFASGSKTVKLGKAGRVAYHCKIHSFMHGTIQVAS